MRRTMICLLTILGTLSCGQVVDLHSLTHVRTIGPGGGTVSLDGFEVSIPAGALEANETFVMSCPDASPEGALGTVFLVEPEGVAFSAAVTLTLAVDVYALPANVKAENLALAWHDGAAWVPLETSVWDGETAHITGLTNHLSLWAAACVPDCPPSSCGGADGCGGTCPTCVFSKKLDVLWVVDNSSSMCQEQQGLVTQLQEFVDALGPLVAADLNMAVVTTDAITGGGVFSDAVAEVYPPGCAKTEILECLVDQDCVDALGASWACNSPLVYGVEPLIENLNLSLNSSCTCQCETSEECCDLFCVDAYCADECSLECITPGGSPDNPAVCVQQPLPCDPAAEGNWDAWARCHFQVGADQSFTANLESGIKAAWLALDPDGPNAVQSAGFLRPDAHLLIVFVSDEDDCSIAETFCSPSFDCEEDEDCPSGACVDGLCCGDIKKDYFNICALLGEYKGEAHHDCAYDLYCEDCQTDDDCQPNWYCKGDKKCRPKVYGFNTIASFQQPAGTPIFALAAMGDYQNRFQSLKDEPHKVMVASMSGDAMVSGGDAASLISVACLEDPNLERCQDYVAIKESPDTDQACLNDPFGEGCEDLLLSKKECARQCYLASKGDNKSPQAKNSYICSSGAGTADWGGRYARMAYMFGVNGLNLNVCAPEGFGPVMQQLGQFVHDTLD